MTMSNKLIDAGFGNVLAYISGHTNALPTINNIANINHKGSVIKAGDRSAQTAA
jgi:hypothetical protein